MRVLFIILALSFCACDEPGDDSPAAPATVECGEQLDLCVVEIGGSLEDCMFSGETKEDCQHDLCSCMYDAGCKYHVAANNQTPMFLWCTSVGY